ncbi:MAG: hypothetical protein IPN20_22235 [Haliscomenobacter sp.]|nr:hypothetical protein [Haliscomenobacter sp.]
MEEQRPVSSVSEWLDGLQRDSWNLELLISGFSIFLLIGLIDKLVSYFGNIWAATGHIQSTVMMLNFLLAVVTLGAITLTINLVLHMLLRGFWIGGIGLRSVSKEIPLEKLRYAEPFASRLSERVPSLDKVLQRIDRICSGIFAFAFLIALMFFSLFSVILVMVGCLFFLTQLIPLFPEKVNFIPGIFIGGFILVWLSLSALYFADTITLGLLKRKRWIARWYYPVYQFFGLVSFAYVYRSIYYHLITNYSRRKIQLALFAYLFGFMAIPFIKYDYFIFFPDTPKGTEMETNYYDALRPEDTFIQVASIPDRMVEGDFLPVFIRYNVNENDRIAAQCNGYTPSKKGGLVSGIRIKNGIRISDPKISEKDPDALLGCLRNYYAVYVDSTRTVPDFYFYRHPQHHQRGILGMVGIASLPPGKHTLRLTRRIKTKGKPAEEDVAEIPFWR